MTYSKHPLVHMGPLSFQNLHLLAMGLFSVTGYHSKVWQIFRGPVLELVWWSFASKSLVMYSKKVTNINVNCLLFS